MNSARVRNCITRYTLRHKQVTSLMFNSEVFSGEDKMLRTVAIIFLAFLLLVSGSHGQVTCNSGVGEFALCQCQMSDGSGTIDLTPYGDASGNPT